MTSEWKTDASCRRIPQADKEHVTNLGWLQNLRGPVQNVNLGPLVQESGEKVPLKILKYQAFSFLPQFHS